MKNDVKAITKINAILMALVIILAVVAGYGWLRPPERVKEEVPVQATLEELAKKEGTIVIYHAIDDPDMNNIIIPAFKKLYPWAKVKAIGMPLGTLTTRVISEYKAGKVSADVIIAALNAFMPAIKEGAVEAWKNPMEDLMNYPTESRDPNNIWHPAYMVPLVIIYRTDMISPDEAPKSYEDLADPRFKGKIGFSRPETLGDAGVVFAHLYGEMSESDWESLMKAIAANEPVMTPSTSDAVQKLISGEVAVIIATVFDYMSLKKEGLPVEIVWPQPTIYVNSPCYLAKNAPHPHMAKLFIQWLTSAAGQYALANTGRPPLHPDLARVTVLAGVLPPDVKLVLACSNNLDFYENPGKWGDKFKEIFG